MTFCRPCRRSVPSTSNFLVNLKAISTVKAIATSFAALALAAASVAQENPPAPPPPDSQPNMQAQPASPLTIPAGTRVALIITQPVQSRNTRRGDDIYAQIAAPVNSGNHVVIPPGTFVQGTVDKIQRNNGRGELRLSSMAITFPDGYVAPVQGPITVETDQGYALQDPSKARVIGAITAPLVGLGVGVAIGHSVGSSTNTITSTNPPGCTGPPPYCLTSSVTGPSNTHTAIGAGVGAAAGTITSLVLLFGSRQFYVIAGSPAEMTLNQAITLQGDEVAKAVQQAARHPVSPQAAAPLPMPPASSSTGTCWTPGTPGTPSVTIPGPPDANGIPGPPTIIPGTPPTPGTPYPCP